MFGRQKNEIVKVKTVVKIVDKETGKIKGTSNVIIQKEEGVRMGFTMAKLAKLKPAFKKDRATGL